MAKHSAPPVQYRWWVPVTVVILATALVVTILVSNQDRNDSSATTTSEHGTEPAAVVTEVKDPEQSDLGDVGSAKESDPMSDGPINAPVKLVVFSDFQCPYCAAWSQETLPRMLDYVDSGDLRIEWREVNVFGSASEQAAKAAYAAALQDKHWEYHDALFAGGKPRSPNGLTPDELTVVAEEIGLDMARFAKDMDAKKTAKAVADNAAMGTDLGAFSTPTFILDGQPYVGAQPTDVFVDAVEAAMKGQN